MRKTLIVLGLISAILAVVLATLPLSNIAFIPAILAFIFGVIAFIISKKANASNNAVKLIFLLTIISLAMATYKVVFNTTEVGDIKELEQKEQSSEEEAIEELEDIEIDIE